MTRFPPGWIASLVLGLFGFLLALRGYSVIGLLLLIVGAFGYLFFRWLDD